MCDRGGTVSSQRSPLILGPSERLYRPEFKGRDLPLGLQLFKRRNLQTASSGNFSKPAGTRPQLALASDAEVHGCLGMSERPLLETIQQIAGSCANEYGNGCSCCGCGSEMGDGSRVSSAQCLQGLRVVLIAGAIMAS